MAFDEDLGYDDSQPIDQDYTVSATGLISRSLSLLAGKFIHYIVIIGIIGAACMIFSAVLYSAIVGATGMFASDPIGYFIGLFLVTTPQDLTLVAISLGFAIFAFLVNVIIAGAAIKFTLDEYGGINGEIGNSFSHSLSRLVPFIIVQLLTTALIAVVIIPAGILLTRAMDLLPPIDPYNPVMPVIPPEAIELLMQGLLFMVVGGIILVYISIRLAPTLAIVIDTDLSAVDSLKKSWELTGGNMLHIFAGMFLMFIVSFVFSLIVSTVTGFTPFTYNELLIIDSVIVTLLFGAFSYIFAVVLYRDLYSRKGGATSNLPGYVM